MAQRKKLSKDERMLVHDKLDGHCACGVELDLSDMQVDHLVPVSRGGVDSLCNMLPACRSCNHYKHSADLETFRSLVENMPRALARDSVTYRNAVRFGLVQPTPQPIIFYFECVGIDT